MTADERDRLLDLHRTAMHVQAKFTAGLATARTLDAVDDRFRDYLFSLEVSA